MVKIKVYPGHLKNGISRGILGHFVEQFPGNIPGGIYDPENCMADEDGFRTDILEKMREMGVSQIRWAGNFSSAYHWMDGIGPVGQRPRKVNFAWEAVEDNRHGTAEFIKLCRKVGAEPIIGVNMGSGTPEEAMNWVEYCNGREDTYYANLRRRDGYEEPFDVKNWCLGNEVYAQWQFGMMDAEEYSRKAMHFAHAMRRADPSIRLTAVGLETDPDWNYKVTSRLSVRQVPYAPNGGDYMDYMSAHYYPIGNESAYTDTDYETRMTMGEFFHERTLLMRSAMEAAADDSEYFAKIVWDEWNPVGTRDGSEFTLEMTMWSSLIMNSFIKDSKYVERANYTFAVGGNGPIQPLGDRILLQPDFYLMKMYAQTMRENLIESICDVPSVQIGMPVDYRWPKWGRAKSKLRDIPVLDVVATGGEKGVTIFITNLSREEDFDVEISLQEWDVSTEEAILHTIWNEDVRATNTLEKTNVELREEKVRVKENAIFCHIKHHSINAVTLEN